MNNNLNEIHIKNLLVQGILGIKDNERKKKQDIIIQAILWIENYISEKNENIYMTINYKNIVNLIIDYVKNNKPFLVEKMCNDLIKLLFKLDLRIKKIRIKIEKPKALKLTCSVAVCIERTR